MNAAAPEGALPRRFNFLAPPCLGEALRRGALVPERFSWVRSEFFIHVRFTRAEMKSPAGQFLFFILFLPA